MSTSLTPRSIEDYLHAHIPLSQAMQVGVVSTAFDEVILSAPLAPNINHRDTVFGGSASAVAILAAWTLLYIRLKQANIQARIVIQRNTMEYELPIVTDFTATARLEDEIKWESFIRLLQRKGRARIAVLSSLDCQGERVGVLIGDFVAVAY